jgi:hypothetical protein
MTGIDDMVTREQLIMRIFALKRELTEAKETIKGLNYSIKQLKDGKENK